MKFTWVVVLVFLFPLCQLVSGFDSQHEPSQCRPVLDGTFNLAGPWNGVRLYANAMTFKIANTTLTSKTGPSFETTEEYAAVTTAVCAAVQPGMYTNTRIRIPSVECDYYTYITNNYL
jgi:hypothetical protein